MSKGTVNKVIIVGRMGKDVELKNLPSGMAIAKLTLATVETRKKGDAYEDETTWHTVKAFGKTAEYLSSYALKGDLLMVEGRISVSEFTGQDGVKKYFTEIIANSVDLLTRKDNNQQQKENMQKHSGKVAAKNNSDDFVDDDLPF